MPRPLEIPNPEPPPPNPTPIQKLGQQPPPEPPAKKPLDMAGAEQFLKTSLGAERYKEVLADVEKLKPEPERDESGRFVKGGTPAEKAPQPKPPAPKPKQPPFRPSPKAKAEPLTPEQIVAAAAEGAAKAITAAKPEPPAAKAPPPPELPAEEQEKVQILAKMEEIQPAKYKGLAEKYRSSLVALDDYAKKWEADHPGEKFDEDSPEHEDFYSKNDVNWSDLDFQRAIARIAVEEANKPLAEKMDEKLAEIERGKELERRQGEIVSHQNSAAQHYWSELGEDMADLVNTDGSLNMAKVRQLQESDPEGLSIRVTAAQSLDAEVGEVYKLYHGLVKNDWEHNPIHRNINQFVAQQEQRLAAKPTQAKLNAEGKTFVPAAQWFKMSKTERENHWMFSAQDIAFLRAKDLAAATNKRIELVEEAHKRWAKSKGIQLENPDAKPESPGAGGEPRLAAVNDVTPKNASPVQSRFLQVALHGS